jgi:membrane-bound metal-dependent hydrolase YbcI (DUF457 family)
MSKNKSTDNAELFKHVMVYTFGIFIMGALNISYFKGGPIWDLAVFVLVNTIAHFLTDWVTSRATSALYKEERYHDFFVVIGADQVLHYITLFGTFIWLTNL